MAQRIIGVSKRLLEVAKKEFLEKGFEGTSIRIIAQKAETSPRAIYTRFENKEELFAAVIEPVYSEFMQHFKEDKINYWDKAKKRDFSGQPESYYLKYLDFAYSHKDEFYLLLKCSKGTRFENFTKDLAELDLQNVNENLSCMIENFATYLKDPSTKLFLETITLSFYNALFAPLVQGLPIELAKAYITKLTRFYNDGIYAGMLKTDKENLLSNNS